MGQHDEFQGEKSTTGKSAQPDKPTGSNPLPKPGRKLAIPHSADFGEQVIGSKHSLELSRLAVPMMGFTIDITNRIESTSTYASESSGAAENVLRSPGTMSMLDAKAFEVASAQLHVDDLPRDLIVGYAPSRSGHQAAHLAVMVKWSDGWEEEHHVELHGRGRQIDAAPQGGVGQREVATTEEKSLPAASFESAVAHARDAAASIATRRKNGMEAAKADAMAYKEAPPAHSFLVDLVEVALSIGIAGIAGVIAKKLATGLGNSIVARMQAAGSATVPKASDLQIVIGMTDAIKEGIKVIGKKTATTKATAKLSDEAKTPPSPKSDSTNDTSTNLINAFFEEQADALLEHEDSNRELITSNAEALAPLQKSSPEVAVAAMSVLADMLSSVKQAAKSEQTLATASAWIAGIAEGKRLDRLRADLPANQVAKEMEEGRGSPQRGTTSEDERGVLRIRVAIASDGQVKVSSAALDGISQEIADRIHREPLAGMAIPVLFKVSSALGDARISRDPSGVIRIVGSIPGGSEGPEEQRILAATNLVAKVGAKSMQEWGLPEIHSNDASGRKS